MLILYFEPLEVILYFEAVNYWPTAVLYEIVITHRA